MNLPVDGTNCNPGYHLASIDGGVYAWVNDDRTLGSRGARNDPYAVFRRRLAAGDPPTSWDALLAAAHPARPVR